MKFFKTLTLSLGALAVSASAAFAATIDFESDAIGSKVNGFISDDSGIVSFSDTMGADLLLFDVDTQGDGVSLLVGGDDASKLQMDFMQDIASLSLDFGNDDPSFVGPGGFAILQGFLDGILADTASVLLNRNDVMDQSISLSGTFDQMFFFYAEADQSPAFLIEVVDNIEYDLAIAAVPVPASLPLLLAGLGGLGVMSRRRKVS